MATVKTIEQFMAELEARGETLVAWSENNQFPYWAVCRVTSRLAKCKRGRMHDIAVRMGIKADPNQQAA